MRSTCTALALLGMYSACAVHEYKLKRAKNTWPVLSVCGLCKLKKLLFKMGSLRRNFWTLVERLGVAFRVLKRTKGEVDLHGLHVLL